MIQPNGERCPPEIQHFNCRFVLVCLPNEAHYKGLHKIPRTAFLPLLSFSLDSPRALGGAPPHLQRQLLQLSIPLRGRSGGPCKVFGGCARNVFLRDQLLINDAILRQQSGLDNLTAEMVFNFVFGNCGSISDGEATGCISSSVVGYDAWSTWFPLED